MQVFVGDVDVALRIHRAAGRPDELTIALTIRPERAVILAVQVAHGDPDAPIDAFERTVHDVQAVVVANHGVARIIKSPPFHRRQPDRQAIREESSLYCHDCTSLC
jgi:hypothetical protein